MRTKSRLMIHVGLGLFFLAFGLVKFTDASFFIDGPYKMFYGFGFPLLFILAVGIIQVFMAIAYFANYKVKIASWAAVVMLGATILVTLPKILTFFQLPPAEAPPGFLFFTAVPVFFMALSEVMRAPVKEPTEHKSH
tara:strand:- start:3349 stop:3759 length:411 start_codon:yes stop_codon:yes gene_type:complete